MRCYDGVLVRNLPNSGGLRMRPAVKVGLRPSCHFICDARAAIRLETDGCYLATYCLEMFSFEAVPSELLSSVFGEVPRG